ncbi:PREDICTED: 50S ribosomal protein L1 [Polistes canadensis]|uniref:50S ribosomal protein L1 n=1 Tax=Polistes canadensis TaxID=91411 RepID=UPI000718DDCF|nr:PREDICTED: 50S ribosomal protein L1 [Polistes canadensis]XP_014614300.1 PREDICTED: 50S ribosomal protein L1 [Polistes canadensis]XP_014614301.1 PREDICTED: 50S ribosomal protein L1 [Polistes canadensis]
MALMFVGRLLNNLCTTSKHNVGVTSQLIIQTRDYAARKGTRARRDAKKIKKKIEKIEKIGFIDKLLKEERKSTTVIKRKRFIEINKPNPIDNVWLYKAHPPKIYTIEEAVQCHREVHHPTMLNCPDSKIIAKFDVSLQSEKKGKFLEPIDRIVDYPYNIKHNETRTILAFVAKDSLVQDVLKAGATIAGGKSLIKSIKGGDLSLNEFQYCVAHPDILPDLLLIRGLMKKKFPTTKRGTMTSDLEGLIKKLVYGTKYVAVPDKLEKQYGLIECPFGTLDMDSKHLEENFAALVKDIYSVKPKKVTTFILRACLISPPGKEYFRVDFNQYLPQETVKKDSVTEELLEEEDLLDAVIPSH